MSLEDELKLLSYRDLQHRAKEAGLKATGKSEELIQRLLDQDAGIAPPPSTVRRSGAAASAKTPRTSRKAADTPVADKAALLRAAASTPLPKGGEAEEQPRSSERGAVRRRLSSQSDKSPAPLRGKSPAPPRRDAVAGLATPTFWLVVLMAATAGLAALAVPYCQQNDCAELARNLPELATDAAAGLSAHAHLRVQAARQRLEALALHESSAALLAQARVRAQATADAAMEQLRSLLASLRKGGSAGAPSCRFDALTALNYVMPVGEQFVPLRHAAAAALSSGGAEPVDKAAAALLVCEAADDCHSALHLLEEAVPHSGACVLHLDARHLGADRGALQAQLAAFLADAPDGVVLLRRIDQMSPELLPVLINALSEAGAFQQGGEPVPTSRATFLLASLMPLDVFAFLGDEIRFKQEAKTRLVVDMTLRAEDKDTAKSQASALRRRLDFVIPIGSDPALAAQRAAAQEAAPSCGLDIGLMSQSLLPEGDEWARLRASAAVAMRQNAATKPPVALLACDDEEACVAAVTEARRAVTGPEACMLALKGSAMGSKNALLNEVVGFIRQVPGGTVVINRIDEMHPDLLSVLLDGLGPDATLAAPDGTGSVSTIGTNFLLTCKLPREVFSSMGDEHRFRQDVHLHMVADSRVRATNKQAAAILAEALQQRIDTALPVGSDPTQYAQWQADQAAAGGARQEEVDPSQWETDAAVAA